MFGAGGGDRLAFGVLASRWLNPPIKHLLRGSRPLAPILRHQHTMSTDASERGPPMQGRGDRAKKYWDMTKAEAAERFGLDHLVEDEEEPDASAGWREEYAHQHAEEGGHE